MLLKNCLPPIFALLLLTGQLVAGTDAFRSVNEERPRKDQRFERGKFELSLVAGALISPLNLGDGVFPRTRTSLDYTQTELRIGYMLHTPWEAGLLRGNFEAIVGLGGGAVIHGPGNAIANGDVIFRYNFVQPHAVVVPFWQLGLGVNASDVARHQEQRLIGRTQEFTIQSSTGIRVLISSRWSVDLEAIYQHISNAGTADRNVGVNAVGGLLGATYSL